MNWMKTYMIEMADLEFRWMEIMEKQNVTSKVGTVRTSSEGGNPTLAASPADATGFGGGATASTGGSGGYPGLNSEP